MRQEGEDRRGCKSDDPYEDCDTDAPHPRNFPLPLPLEWVPPRAA